MIRVFCDYWKKAFYFRGTTDRNTFWMTLAVCYLGSMVCFLPVMLVYAGVLLLLKAAGCMPVVTQETAMGMSLVYMIVYLLPLPALLVRRARDARIPWWQAAVTWIGYPLFGLLVTGLWQEKPADAIPWGKLTRVGYGLALPGLSVLVWGMLISVLSGNVGGMVGFFGVGMALVIPGVFIACIGLDQDKARAMQDRNSPQ